ncbi:MAG: hypothetical protein ACXW18_01130 [Pyrinomonadaceae bacterium]
MREGLQESFLRGFFSLTAIAKEAMRDVKDPRAIPANNLGKCRLVFCACLPRQLEIGRLFVTVRQKCSSSKLRLAGPV